MPRKKTPLDTQGLQKCPTGIPGLDQLTMGGLPKGRPTLVTGAAGSGKTLLAMQFLVNGANKFSEPGVFMSFEETSDELSTNVQSLGFDIKHLEREKKLNMEYVYIEKSEIEETGEYDLEGLFLRLNYAIDSIKAKRVVLDTLEVLFGGLKNENIIRAELRRLFRWLKKKGVTAVVTGEKGSVGISRFGLEEYVADCVIVLDHRVTEQISTRRLRIVKYRGSFHGMNEYPFLIDHGGISVLPITSTGLNYDVSNEIVSTGIPGLDAMFGAKGFYKGSNVLISGTAGTGKSTMGAHFAEGACKRGEKCLLFAFEEAPHQIIRNMKSAGIDLEPCVTTGHLMIRSARPTSRGLESHLVDMIVLLDTFKPDAVVVDPITNFLSVGSSEDIKSMLTRFVDTLKERKITSLFTSLTGGNSPLEWTDIGISSLMDTWIVLKDIENPERRDRGLTIVKSRGMAHSSDFRSYHISDRGFTITPGRADAAKQRKTKETTNGQKPKGRSRG
ncbi:MAG: circadian clock protein KaiC [Syntrophorhabdus sp.]